MKRLRLEQGHHFRWCQRFRSKFSIRELGLKGPQLSLTVKRFKPISPAKLQRKQPLEQLMHKAMFKKEQKR